MTLEGHIKAALAAVGTDIKALQQAGGGVAPWQFVTVDCGATAEQKSIFVPVPGMLPTQVVEVRRSIVPAPGKGTDEHLAEPAVLATFAGTDGFTVQIMAQGCTCAGPMNITYRVN